MPHSFQRCVIHIGTEKTGTSAIQQFLYANRAGLAKDGILYPDLGKGGSQWELVAPAHPHPWKDRGLRARLGISNAEDANVFRKRLTRTLDSSFRAADHCHTLVVSSEHFHSRLKNTAAIAGLKRFLDRWSESYEVHVYFRRQDRVAISLNSTRIKSGGVSPTWKIPRKIKEIPRYYLYDKIFSDWAAIFGAEAMKANLYEEDNSDAGSLVERFCGRASIGRVDKPSSEKVNTSLSGEGLAILVKINKLLEDAPERERHLQRQNAVRILTERYKGKHYFMSRREAEDYYALFGETNARLKDLAFADHEGPIFDEDFSEYPYQVPELNMSNNGISQTARSILREAELSSAIRKPIRTWRHFFKTLGK